MVRNARQYQSIGLTLLSIDALQICITYGNEKQKSSKRQLNLLMSEQIFRNNFQGCKFVLNKYRKKDATRTISIP